jgi:matrix metalloproteinase-23 (CA-MMP)
MGRGACIPCAASGAVQARWLGAVLGGLCLVPALVLLARLGTPSAPAWSAAQVSSGARCAGWAAPHLTVSVAPGVGSLWVGM